MMSMCHELGGKRKGKVLVMAEILTSFFKRIIQMSLFSDQQS